MSDVSYSEWERTLPGLPSLHFLKKALGERLPALAALPGVEDGCSVAELLQLVAGGCWRCTRSIRWPTAPCAG